MNKIRRKSLQEIADKLAELKEELEALQSEEEDYRDNMPENFQGSERYERADAACDSLSEAADSLDSAISSIEEAIE